MVDGEPTPFVERIDVEGPNVVALHPRPNENALFLGYAAMRDGSLTTQERVGMVGARGFDPAIPTPQIVLAEWIAYALHGAA